MYRTRNGRKIEIIMKHNIEPVYWEGDYAYFKNSIELRNALESYEIFMAGFSRWLMDIIINKNIFNDIYFPHLKDNSKRYEVYYGGAGSGKSYFVATKLVYKALVDKRKILIDLHTFDNDALIMKGITSNKISLKNKASGKTLLTMDFTGFPYLAIWSKPNAPFICIEPWYSTADNVKSTGVFTQKQDIISLKPNTLFECKYTVEFF